MACQSNDMLANDWEVVEVVNDYYERNAKIAKIIDRKLRETFSNLFDEK